ncbi:hypothetical protein GCM10023189_41750 [Nibrella saemangeumensis]|uniref:Uncharacterized protein n=1 Tax=Nibrella saemangeumensis TaxID=1084526 RepID=A0ABP8N9G3_9BACT
MLEEGVIEYLVCIAVGEGDRTGGEGLKRRHLIETDQQNQPAKHTREQRRSGFVNPERMLKGYQYVSKDKYDNN